MGLSGIHFISFLTGVDSLGIAQNPLLAISLLKAAQSSQGSIEMNRNSIKPFVLQTRRQQSGSVHKATGLTHQPAAAGQD